MKMLNVFLKKYLCLGLAFGKKSLFQSQTFFSVRANLRGITQTGIKFRFWTPVWSPKTELEKNEPQILTSDTPGVAVKKYPIKLMNGIKKSAAVSIDEINSSINDPALPLPNKIESKADDPIQQSIDVIEENIELDEVENNDEASISPIEFISYVLINIVVLSLLGGFLWWYLKRKKNNRKESKL